MVTLYIDLNLLNKLQNRNPQCELTTEGIMDASTTLRFSTPTTRHSSSTTVVGSEVEPILQVHEGWYAVSDLALVLVTFSPIYHHVFGILCVSQIKWNINIIHKLIVF